MSILFEKLNKFDSSKEENFRAILKRLFGKYIPALFYVYCDSNQSFNSVICERGYGLRCKRDSKESAISLTKPDSKVLSIPFHGQDRDSLFHRSILPTDRFA